MRFLFISTGLQVSKRGLLKTLDKKTGFVDLQLEGSKSRRVVIIIIIIKSLFIRKIIIGVILSTCC